MKKLLGVILVIIMALFALPACGNHDNEIPPTEGSEKKVLIVYFSCTNTTEAIAEHIQAETTGTLYKIIPEVPYTEDDLKYYTDCRADREQADSTARPAISGSVEDMGNYDVVFLGYPIWHGQAPKIIYTFLESYDFSGKMVIPFCTSQSSGIGSSDTNLHPLAPSAEWVSGKRFSSGTSLNTVADWIKGLDISE
ncbi:MAG: flavodoxin [Clostridia bacterium]|nr:flavodoxin [Clostridia bacterium]